MENWNCRILDYKDSRFLKKFYLFILRERERDRERESKSRGGAERGRERIPSRFHAVSTDPDAELKPTNHEIMT